ncbi:hypothetical protein [Bacteroides sp.]|uniref:hypothetical protein n=1 Tax=Bacteroides sp. TaxID=29523 RepID=UPI0025C57D5D|nr:hypothetical protein [Bacteroides sp.]
MKVIHVYLIFKKKNYYFGSLSAIYDYLNEDEVGIKKSTLLHRSNETTILTPKAIIIKSTLLRCRNN